MRGAGDDLRRPRARCAVARHRAGPVERDIAGRLGKSCGAPASAPRAASIDRRQFLVVDRDQLGGVLRRRERSPRPPSRPARRHASRGRRPAPGGTASTSLAPLRPTSGGCASDAADAGRVHVRGGEHRDHALRLARGRRYRSTRCAHAHAASARTRRRPGSAAARPRRNGRPAHQRVVLDAGRTLGAAGLVDDMRVSGRALTWGAEPIAGPHAGKSPFSHGCNTA